MNSIKSLLQCVYDSVYSLFNIKLIARHNFLNTIKMTNLYIIKYIRHILELNTNINWTFKFKNLKYMIKTN